MAALFIPTRQDIDDLKVGDLALNCWGKLAVVAEICCRKDDIGGKRFVLYYTRTSDTSTMSMSMKEGKLVRHANILCTSAETDAIERSMLTGIRNPCVLCGEDRADMSALIRVAAGIPHRC